MSLKNVFLIHAIVAGIFALIALLMPATFLSIYGMESNDSAVLMTRVVGVSLLGIALISFYLKDAELTKEVKSVVLALLISEIFGVIVAIFGTISNIFNSLGWTIVIIYGFFSVAHYSIYSKK
ncbi:hypothetical protein ACFL5D_04465 [Candidatus Neomarinimicrobiota bacterium]